MPSMTVVYYVNSGVLKPIKKIYRETNRTEIAKYITCHIISKYITSFPDILGEVSCGVGQVPGKRAEEGRGGAREGESGLCSDWLAWLCGGGDCGLPTKWARWACVINSLCSFRYFRMFITNILLHQKNARWFFIARHFLNPKVNSFGSISQLDTFIYSKIMEICFCTILIKI